MARLATTKSDFETVLRLWNEFLPELDAAYGAENVNHNRRLVAIEREGTTHTEFWISDRDDAYFALRRREIEEGLAWEFFQACFAAGTRPRRFARIAKELLTEAVRDRGRELGFDWAFCDTSPLLAQQSKDKLDEVAVALRDGSYRTMNDAGETEIVTRERRVFDLRRFEVS